MLALQVFTFVMEFMSVIQRSYAGYDNCIGKTENESLRLFPQEPDCGVTFCIKVESRIKGGKDAELGQYPWMATIIVSYSLSWLKYEALSVKKQRCAGSIINSKHILSAGHCFLVEEDNRNNPFLLDISGVQAFVGDWDLSTDPDTQDRKNAPSRLKAEVERIFFYPGHEIARDHIWWDVALLRLKNQLQFNDFVKAICLPFGCSSESINTFYRNVVFQAGWGYFEDGLTIPDRLQYQWTSITEKKVCKDSWAREGQILTDHQICVDANDTTSPCSGDAGGPLMITYVRRENRSQCVSYNMGILSFGRFRCYNTEENKIPAVYTWVPALLDWIVTNVKD